MADTHDPAPAWTPDRHRLSRKGQEIVTHSSAATASASSRAKKWARRVGRLLQENGIVVDLLDREFMADRPNQKWAGDISYIWIRQDWLYLAVILDLHFCRAMG